jgi:CHAD domain-containing protein
MATGITVAGSATEHRDLAYWMERVLKELERVQTSPDPDSVHDLRVAIRRCRSVASVVGEVDPNPAWPSMRRLPRKLFRELGELRDTQVLEEWTKSLSVEGDLIRELLLAHFSEKEADLRDGTLRAAAKFNLKIWKKLERTLRRRARVVPPDGPAAECLALERLESARQLHSRTFRSTNSETWHALRIGLKKFRYTVESLLPVRYVLWGSDLKKVQDLLGEVHDLDVLSQTIRQLARKELEERRDAWIGRITLERNHRLETYRDLTLGKMNLWHDWRQGLPDGAKLESAGLARLRATVRSMDKDAKRSGQVSALAMRLYDRLARLHAAPVFGDKSLRKIIRAAARIHGIGSALESREPQKAARDFLMEMARPAGWSAEEWQLMAMVVRYHRGGQPKLEQKGFAKLSESERGKVCACAGVLRLARVLWKCGVQTTVGVRVEKSVDAVIVWVPGWIDTEETAAGIAAGKYLLETCLRCPLLLKAVPASSNVVELRNRLETTTMVATTD